MGATPDVSNQIHVLVMDDGRLKVRENASTVRISSERVNCCRFVTKHGYTSETKEQPEQSVSSGDLWRLYLKF